MRDCLRPGRRSLNIARAQDRPHNRPPKLLRGAFRAASRADAESADEAGQRARQRRFSEGSGG
eukprot:15144872-Alexandrium_andersonii.AAC.1